MIDKFNINVSPADFLERWIKFPYLNSAQQKILRRYYKNYLDNFSQYKKDNYNKRFDDIIKIISLNEAKKLKVLDIGSGCGTESLFFSMKGCDVKGIDLDHARTEVAKKRKEILERKLNEKLNCDFKIQSIFNLKQKKFFDVIWIMETFHHIEPRDKFVKILPFLLKDDGYLIISESNALNIGVQYIMFKSRGFSTKKIKVDCDGKKHAYGRERILRASNLNKLLKKQGMVCEYVRYFRIFNDLRGSDRILRLLEKNIPGFFSPLFIHYNYIGRKCSEKN